MSGLSITDIVRMPRCPDCNIPLRIRALPPKGPFNRYGYGSMWYCPRCVYEQFNRESMVHLLEQLPRNRGYENYRFLPPRPPRPTRYYPKCRDCRGTMRHFNLPPQGRENRYGYKTYWVCDHCGTELLSHKTIKEWRQGK